MHMPVAVSNVQYCKTVTILCSLPQLAISMKLHCFDDMNSPFNDSAPCTEVLVASFEAVIA